MNATKLGLRITSSVLATALTLAPVRGAVAAPAAAPAPAPLDPQPVDEVDEGEDPEGEDPEGEGVDPEAVTEGEEGEEPVAEEPVEPEEPEVEEPEPEEPEPEPEPEEEEAEPEEEEAELPIVPEGPLRPAEPTWGPKDQFPMNGKGMLITGGVVTGLGAGFIVTSILITGCDYESALSCKLAPQRDFLVPLAVASTGLGLLLLGVGVGNRIKYKRWERWAPETAVVPTMVPGGGGGVAMVGRF
ncbi:hypothetical protein DB30_04157 [Enhygromyxa salina]|uniref:IgA FC receptor n=1 Tax=Enhygromyxa salina TaxID=215803 RepID=A0A0C1ZGE0_9BACT|nr:hypothetical protein [Enhygromyxa salina]KIG16684.1 hypothetical protein DB30_04157 [Enhygromyxa salina]